MFDLTRPCADCPFRADSLFGLSTERLEGIFNAPAFQCHKTVDYSENEPQPGNRPQQCAGLMALLYRTGQPNSIMQVAERLGYLDPAKLDPQGVVFASLDEARDQHRKFA